MVANFSIYTGLKDYSHFGKKNYNGFDPFYMGGVDGFAGYSQFEKSAPIFKLYQLGVVYKPWKNVYSSVKLQGLNYANNDDWSKQNIVIGGALTLGYKTPLGPIEFCGAVAQDNTSNLYLSFGYTGDVFFFSRR